LQIKHQARPSACAIQHIFWHDSETTTPSKCLTHTYTICYLTPCAKKRKILAKIRRRTRRRILKALRMARADAGLTISELANRAGVSRDTISNAEKGRHGLQATTLHKLAAALGKAPSELLAEEERLAPKVESRSSREPSFNDVLEDERRVAIHELALEAARRQAQQDSQAFARAKESGQPQTYVMRHENEAMLRLLEYPEGELADALIELARRCVELENNLQQTVEETADRSRSASA
jgi:transcriptional regulator with XRE-family HTH domain